jgi:hypothetical protein
LVHQVKSSTSCAFLTDSTDCSDDSSPDGHQSKPTTKGKGPL